MEWTQENGWGGQELQQLFPFYWFLLEMKIKELLNALLILFCWFACRKNKHKCVKWGWTTHLFVSVNCHDTEQRLMTNETSKVKQYFANFHFFSLYSPVKQPHCSIIYNSALSASIFSLLQNQSVLMSFTSAILRESFLVDQSLCFLR